MKKAFRSTKIEECILVDINFMRYNCKALKFQKYEINGTLIVKWMELLHQIRIDDSQNDDHILFIEFHMDKKSSQIIRVCVSNQSKADALRTRKQRCYKIFNKMAFRKMIAITFLTNSIRCAIYLLRLFNIT